MKKADPNCEQDQKQKRNNKDSPERMSPATSF